MNWIDLEKEGIFNSFHKAVGYESKLAPLIWFW